jgi:hypothetical protein
MSRCQSVSIDTGDPHRHLTHANLSRERDVAERSVLIKNIVGDLGEEALVDAIPISNVSPSGLTTTSFTEHISGLRACPQESH